MIDSFHNWEPLKISAIRQFKLQLSDFGGGKWSLSRARNIYYRNLRPDRPCPAHYACQNTIL